MMRLPRFVPAVILACATALPLARFSYAQDAPGDAKPGDAIPGDIKPGDAIPAEPKPAEPKPADPVPATPDATPDIKPDVKKVDEPLKKSVDDFWHYGKVGRYDLATEAGKRILGSGASADDVLTAFEQVTADRKDDVMAWMLRWQQLEPMQAVSTDLIKKLHEGLDSRKLNPAFIRRRSSAFPPTSAVTSMDWRSFARRVKLPCRSCLNISATPPRRICSPRFAAPWSTWAARR